MQNTLESHTRSRFATLSLPVKLLLLESTLIILGVLAVIIYWNSTANSRALISAQQRDLEILSFEREQCSALIQQQQGDFNQYEYCRQLLQRFAQE